MEQNTQESGNNRSRSLFSFCSFHFLDDGFTDAFYIILPFLALELGLSLTEVGLLKGIFAGSMGVFQLPMALLGEKVGELTIIALGTLGLAAGFIMLSLSYKLTVVIISLVTAKSAAAGQHSLSSALLSRTFEDSGRRTAMGTYNFSGDLGKVVIPFALAMAINLWGWRDATFAVATAVLVAGILLWLFSRQRLTSLPVNPPEEKKRGWGITNRLSFSSLLTMGIIDYSVRVGLLTFLPFLLIEKGTPIAEVGFALTLVFAGGAIGKFACGFMAERFGITAMIVGTELATAAGIISIYYLDPATIWIILPLVGVALNGTSSVLYASVAEIISPQKRSRGYGLYYGLTLGSGAVSPVLFGWLAQSSSLGYVFIFLGALALLTLPFTWILRSQQGY
jgi:MFS transporter, FSR family, fosmidomycin resistance protein